MNIIIESNLQVLGFICSILFVAYKLFNLFEAIEEKQELNHINMEYRKNLEYKLKSYRV